MTLGAHWRSKSAESEGKYKFSSLSDSHKKVKIDVKNVTS